MIFAGIAILSVADRTRQEDTGAIISHAKIERFSRGPYNRIKARKFQLSRSKLKRLKSRDRPAGVQVVIWKENFRHTVCVPCSIFKQVIGAFLMVLMDGLYFVGATLRNDQSQSSHVSQFFKRLLYEWLYLEPLIKSIKRVHATTISLLFVM